MSGQQTGNDYDLDLVMGGDVADSGLPHGGLMNDFVEAVCARDTDRTAQARTVIVETLGEAAMVDAAAMIAAFNAYPRMADATGIPLEDGKAIATLKMRQELDLETINNAAP
ncbi:MAG: hypothetical protein HOK21_19315 [Rhodospirillaceae bacterium]|nr:hypothetical protein [Rhodospirillaceae bacterium]MBT4689799.1 hypothetical protein [Rhodospirillaceae bacterium]MBT5083936.1 hypothetical protein [Rhodospirillaceae bacterium]MBT5526241.1 hypothetical protein [Rhodospirillaceae bacterium]MBT5878210.1 hypothetical protein [Rhodospirillaceae bacterium]